MFKVLWFILNSIIDFAKMLFTIQVDDNLSLGLLMCICFIFFPMMLRVIKFIRQDALEELDEAYDSTHKSLIFGDNEYSPKHASAGRHSSEYFRRQKQLRRFK